jgi:hypothetical protein
MCTKRLNLVAVCSLGAWVIARSPGTITEGRALYSEVAFACGGYRDGPQRNAHTSHSASRLHLAWFVNGNWGHGYDWKPLQRKPSAAMHIDAHCLGEGSDCRWSWGEWGGWDSRGPCEKSLPWSQDDQRTRQTVRSTGSTAPPIRVSDV